MRTDRLAPCFVEHIPETLTPGIIYISMPLASAIHLCACGCGEEVVTPLSPTDWRLSYDGETVSLRPSIGNWSFLCKSHYWLRRGQVKWSGNLSSEEIGALRAADEQRRGIYYQKRAAPTHTENSSNPDTDRQTPTTRPENRWRTWIRRILP